MLSPGRWLGCLATPGEETAFSYDMNLLSDVMRVPPCAKSWEPGKNGSREFFFMTGQRQWNGPSRAQTLRPRFGRGSLVMQHVLMFEIAMEAEDAEDDAASFLMVLTMPAAFSWGWASKKA